MRPLWAIRHGSRDGEVVRHVSWFLGAVENFRFFDLQVHAFADPQRSREVKPRDSSSRLVRIYRQD